MTQRLNTAGKICSVLLIFSFIFLFSLSYVGCKRGADSQNSDAEQQDQVANDSPQFSTEIRSLPQNELDKLGPKNDLSTEYVYPGAQVVQIVYPQRLKQDVNGDSIVEFLSESTFQLPIKELASNADVIMFSSGLSLETLKDYKTNATIQEGYPVSAEFVYLSFSEPVDKDSIVNATLNTDPSAKVATKRIGNNDVQYCPTPQLLQIDQSNFAKIDNICISVSFPTENSVVFGRSSESSLDLYFSDKKGDERGIAAQRIARMSLEPISIASQYDYDLDFPNTLLVKLPVPVTQDLMVSVQHNVSAFQFLFNFSDKEGDLLKVVINTKSQEGATELRKELGTAIMKAVDTISQAARQNNGEDKSLELLVNIMKSINLSTVDNSVVGTVKFSQESVDFITSFVQQVNDVRVNSQIYAEYDVAENLLRQLNQAFTAYYTQNECYPTSIKDTNGTPLLSWRVALLPVFGDEGKKLYDQFKLDEPWNSENNIKLLDECPGIYKTSDDPTQKSKTRFLVFNAPNTPFGKATNGLKIQDVVNPARVLSVVFVAPELATEWTRPEELTFNPEKPSETFGPFVCAVTLLGQILRGPCNDSEDSAKEIAALIYGTESENPKEKESVTAEDVNSNDEKTSSPDSAQALSEEDSSTDKGDIEKSEEDSKELTVPEADNSTETKDTSDESSPTNAESFTSNTDASSEPTSESAALPSNSSDE